MCLITANEDTRKDTHLSYLVGILSSPKDTKHWKNRLTYRLADKTLTDWTLELDWTESTRHPKYERFEPDLEWRQFVVKHHFNVSYVLQQLASLHVSRKTWPRSWPIVDDVITGEPDGFVSIQSEKQINFHQKKMMVCRPVTWLVVSEPTWSRDFPRLTATLAAEMLQSL